MQALYKVLTIYTMTQKEKVIKPLISKVHVTESRLIYRKHIALLMRLWKRIMIVITKC